jgi:hypothetical protein
MTMFAFDFLNLGDIYMFTVFLEAHELISIFCGHQKPHCAIHIFIHSSPTGDSALSVGLLAMAFVVCS